jgi:membrane protein insertase Oxa1/YidC/SpoIIIJ
MTVARTAKSAAIRLVFIGLAVISAPVAAQMPMAVIIYWITSATFSLAQNLVFRHPIVRSKLGFPSLNASQKLLEKYR